MWRQVTVARATRYARQFIQLIVADCAAVAVAGEVRRQRPTDLPIEIVAVPTTFERRNLFGEALPEQSLLDETLARLLVRERIEERVERRGRKREPNTIPFRLLFRADGGMLCPVDLWRTTPGRFGAVLALRTGPYGYRSRLVAPVGSRSVSGGAGLLPRDLSCHELTGLTYRATGVEVAVPDEAAFFARIDVPLVAPELRR